MSLKEFKLPDVGEGVAEGELVSWLVAPGDTVTEDQPVAEVETDKALVEVPSPYNGTVKELHAEEGQMVPVGDVIVTYEVDDGESEDERSESSERTASEASREQGEAEGTADSDAEALEDADTPPEPETADGVESGAAGSRPEGGTDAGADAGESPSQSTGRVFAPPSARRLARELGVDIGAVDGSGPGGRVTEGDVRAHAESGGSDEDAAAGDAAGESGDGASSGPKQVEIGDDRNAVSRRGEGGNGAAASEAGSAGAAASSVERAGRERTLAAPATRKAAEDAGVDLNDVPTDETRDGEAFVSPEQVQQYAQAVTEAKEVEARQAEAGEAAGPGAEAGSGATAGGRAVSREPESVPYRGVRRTIGEKMAQSKYTAPHVTHHDTAVVDRLAETRGRLKERAAERDVKLTYLPFVMKALVAGLKEFPVLNSELREEDEEILLKKEYNIGIAVATDAGLMVPVVRNVDEKGLVELAAEVNDLASRARERKVSREEMQGGTFTITNFGAIGGEYATPVINYPETAIMGLGAIDERPVAENGEVRAAMTLPLSLTIDHRVIDGADAGRFTNYVMERLEDPELLLLD